MAGGCAALQVVVAHAKNEIMDLGHPALQDRSIFSSAPYGGQVSPTRRARLKHVPVLLPHLRRGLQALPQDVPHVVSQAHAENEDIHLSFVPRAGIADEGPQAEVGAGVRAAEHFVRQAAEAPRDLGRLARARLPSALSLRAQSKGLYRLCSAPLA